MSKFNRSTEFAGVINVGRLKPTAYATQFNYYHNYLKYKDYKTASNPTATKHRTIQTLNSFKPFKNEYSISLKISDNSSTEPFWVHVYNGAGYSDKHGITNLATWVSKHRHIGDLIRIKCVGCNAKRSRKPRILATDIQKVKQPVKVIN